MTLTDIPIADLIDELERRGAISIVSAEQRINGVEFANNLGQGDELRVTAIRMAQLMVGRAVADDVDLHHVTKRKLKTSASEDISVAVMCIKGAAVKAAAAQSEGEPV
jgi:hypothetical protein